MHFHFHPKTLCILCTPTGPGRKKMTPAQKKAAKEARQASATQSQVIPSAQTSKRAKKRVNVVSSSEDE